MAGSIFSVGPNYQAFCRAALLFVWFAAGLLSSYNESFGYNVLASPPCPTGVLQTNLPEIGQRIVSLSPGTVTAISILLNGVSINATYDQSRHLAHGSPASPLDPGLYHVEMSLVFSDGGAPLRSHWQFTVPTGAKSEATVPDEDQCACLKFINAIRDRYALPSLTIVDSLDSAAQAHSDYLVTNRVVGHTEEAQYSGFTGRLPIDRVAAFGYAGSVTEDFAIASDGHIGELVGLLFDAPYHRLPFLQPGTGDVGIGCAIDKNGRMVVTIEFGCSDSDGLVVSPAEHERNVPLTWTDNETPDPLRMHDQQAQTGYPIVLVKQALDNEKLTVTQYSLTDSNGNSVACYCNSPTNDDHLRSAIVIIPIQPLMAKTEYFANVQGATDTGTVFNKTWSFSTIPATDRY